MPSCWLMVAAFSKYSRAVLYSWADQLAVDQTDAQVQEGEVGGDLRGLDVLIDGIAVIAPGFEHGAQHAVGIHRVGGQLDCLFGILLGLVPLLLVEQHFGVEGQRQGILRVEQVGRLAAVSAWAR